MSFWMRGSTVLLLLAGLFGAAIPYYEVIPEAMLGDIVSLMEHCDAAELRAHVRMELVKEGISVVQLDILDAAELLLQVEEFSAEPLALGEKESDQQYLPAASSDEDSVVPWEMMPQPEIMRLADDAYYGNGHAPGHPGTSPLLGSEVAFERLISKAQSLGRVCDSFFQTDLSLVQPRRVLRALTAAIMFDDPNVFNHLTQALDFSKCSGMDSDMAALFRAATFPASSVEYLDDLLGQPSFTAVQLVHSMLDYKNAHLHQCFAKHCSGRITRSMGRLLLLVEVEPSLRAYWDTRDTGLIMQPEFWNVAAAEMDTGVMEHFSDSRFEIHALYSRSGQPIPLAQFPTVELLRKRFERLAQVCDMQRRFAILHVDKVSWRVTLLKSPNPAGPHFLLHTEAGMAAAPMGAHAKSEGLRVVEYDLAVGDIIIGATESIMSQARELASLDFASCVSSEQAMLQLLSVAPASQLRSQFLLGRIAPGMLGDSDSSDEDSRECVVPLEPDEEPGSSGSGSGAMEN